MKKSDYLHFWYGFSCPATTGTFGKNLADINASKEKWYKFFKGDIKNYSGQDFFTQIGNNCDPRKAVEAETSTLLKEGDYQSFLSEHSDNFCLDIEQSFAVVKSSPILINKIIQENNRIIVPFKNGPDVLISHFFTYFDKEVNVNIRSISCDRIWHPRYCDSGKPITTNIILVNHCY